MKIAEKNYRKHKKGEMEYYTQLVFVKDSRRKTCVLLFHITILSVFVLAKDLFQT